MICENFEVNISALMDNELTGKELLQTLDHIVGCESCRKFYTECRSLESLIQNKPNLENVEEIVLPEQLWDSIVEKASRKKTRIFHFPGSPQIWAVAAMLFLAVGLWVGGVLKLPNINPERHGDVVELRLEENKGKMTEDRFIELTTELLKADRSYHRKMLEVMETVNRNDVVVEGSLDPGAQEDARTSEPQRNRLSRSEGMRPSSPVEISFW
ncbi:zf-HC2 domain-containing protein [bacterium]|nr:zf-HC2 domain-containing protein [bacterium]